MDLLSHAAPREEGDQSNSCKYEMLRSWLCHYQHKYIQSMFAFEILVIFVDGQKFSFCGPKLETLSFMIIFLWPQCLERYSAAGKKLITTVFYFSLFSYYTLLKLLNPSGIHFEYGSNQILDLLVYLALFLTKVFLLLLPAITITR